MKTANDYANDLARTSRERRVRVSSLITPAYLAEITEPAKTELVRQGLIYLGNNAAHHMNTAPGDGEAEPRSVNESARGDPSPGTSTPPVLQPGHPHPRDEWAALRQVYLTAADGQRQMPLLEMAVEDLREAVNRFRGQAIGMAAKADALETLACACVEAGVSTPADLPTSQLDKLNRTIQRAWERA